MMMTTWLLVTSLLCPLVCSAVPGTDTASLCSSLSPCSRPLGLENGHLPDLSITASSSYSSSVGPSMARLNREEGGGAWCPSSVLTNSSQEWLQVRLGREVLVTGLISQGRWDRGLGQEWAQTLQVQYWSYGLWVVEGQTRQANTDTFTPVLLRLGGQEDSLGVVTDKIRVVPVTQHPRTVCLRLELCGCHLEDGHHQVGFDDVHDEVHDVKEELELRGGDVPAEERDDNSSPNVMSVVIGVLVTIILLLTTVIIFILYKNSLLSPQPVTTSVHKLCPEVPDHFSHYSNDSYSEYSRPLLGYQHQHQHKILWDLTFPQPPPPPGQQALNNRHHQVQQQTTVVSSSARGNFTNLAFYKINNFPPLGIRNVKNGKPWCR